MSDASLRALAQAAGILLRWRDYRGHEHEVPPDTLRSVLTALELPCGSEAQVAESLQALRDESKPLPQRDRAGPEQGQALARRAPSVQELSRRPRPWGLTVQLYALRRAGDGGLGDFTALAECARAAARAGADALAISPVHAPFVAEPQRFSPYMPSNRLLLNPWYIDPDAAAGEFPEGGASAPTGPGSIHNPEPGLSLVDWPLATSARLARLRELYRQRAPRLRDDVEFRAFCAHAGPELEDHARFEALQAWQMEHGHGRDWHQWSPALRDPRSAAVHAFAREHDDAVTFHLFLQWLADDGLRGAQAAARNAGMALGLIADLAVGVDPVGSETWAQPRAMLRGVALGAPPDQLNAHGQNWALTTFSPRALARQDGAPLRTLLQAALRHARGVRIDHVLGLNRLWVIPDGARPTEGAYLRCPLERLLDVVASEATRRRALVVGEDLGTIPEGLQDRLAASGLLGLRVLWFMRDHGLFVDPSRWPETAVATTATHDLPSVAGWWRGRDIEWRARAGQLDAIGTAAEQAARIGDRRALWDAFVHAGVARGALPDADLRPAIDAALRFVARAPAPLALIPIEDVAGFDEQPNLPGTIDEHPNWRRRLPAAAPDLLAQPDAVARLRAIREERETRL